MIEIKVINKGHHPLPAYATGQSAGLDLRANIQEPIVLHPMERKLVPTGLYIALPKGYEAQVRPRSGLRWTRKLIRCRIERQRETVRVVTPKLVEGNLCRSREHLVRPRKGEADQEEHGEVCHVYSSVAARVIVSDFFYCF